MIDFAKQQGIQHDHDIKNHFDVISLGRIDRLKHYGLHFAKYSGRLARGTREYKSREETIVDALLVCLSAANALNQALPSLAAVHGVDDLDFIDAAGRFADACEKIDHLEEFRELALTANIDIARWLVSAAALKGLDVNLMLDHRRVQLSSRIVYLGK